MFQIQIRQRNSIVIMLIMKACTLFNNYTNIFASQLKYQRNIEI